MAHTNPQPDPERTATALLRRPDWPQPRRHDRYGPPGTTDSPRYRGDGITPWPREPKGDRETHR